MWPTEYTPWLLLFGIVPVLYAFWLVLKNGAREATSLRFVNIIVIWIGYHLSPGIAYIDGQPWQSFLLAPSRLDEALAFSAMAMFSILLGYAVVFRRREVRLRRSVPGQWLLPRAKASWVLALAVVVFALVVNNIGGLEELWVASYSRGEGQWAERTLSVRFSRALNVLMLPLAVCLIVIAALHLLKNPRLPSRIVVGSIGLLVAMLPWIHGFSRMAGFPLLILVFLAFKFRKASLPMWGVSAALVCVALYLGQVGLDQRGFYSPGVGSYLHAMVAGQSTPAGHAEAPGWIQPDINPLDASAPFTRKIYAMSSDGTPQSLSSLGLFVYHINPVPSLLLPPGSIGPSLSTAMGTTGSTGLTTPALAEIFVVFGYLGLALTFMLGAVYGYLDRYALRYPGAASQLAVLLAVLSVGIGLHSGIRALTRPLLYGAVLLLMFNHVSAGGFRVRKVRRQEPLSSKLGLKSQP